MFVIDNSHHCLKMDAITQMNRQLQVENYADNTRRTYLSHFKAFYYSKYYKEPIRYTDIMSYLQYQKNRGLSNSALHQVINALKFYLEKVCKENKQYFNIARPRKEKALPVILNEKELKSLFEAIHNIKHKTILRLIYACGLRVGELLSIELRDIDGKRKQAHIRRSKGHKDRIVPLSDSILAELRTYYRIYRPSKYLFEGTSRKGNNVAYSASSVRAIFKRAVKKAGIKKQVKLHSLRHSYATHLLEHGIDLRYIQTLLGHNSSRTTEIYTHVSRKKLSNIPSPIDFL